MIKDINTIRNEKDAKAKIKTAEKRKEYLKRKAVVEAVDIEKRKERAKEYYKAEGQKKKREDTASTGRYKKFKKAE